MARLTTVKVNATWLANMEALGHMRDAGSNLTDIRIERFDSMSDVVKQAKAHNEFTGMRKGHSKTTMDRIESCAVNGDAERLKRVMALSDKLVDDAIAHEPRLARRPQWTRSDDGLFADAGLVASGDDSPCYQMTRETLRNQSAAGEPVTVVISTDSNDMAEEDAAAAFIATTRLVQQFRPVHVWWQGAWMNTNGREAGYVFLAPLVSNDMDFARVDYVLADQTRDGLSFRALYMAAVARDHFSGLTGISRHADRAYIPDAKFVDRGGIKSSAEQVAAHACYWLGWDSPWTLKYRQDAKAESAMQELPTEPEPFIDNRTDAQKARDMREMDEHWDRQRKNERRNAMKRAKAVQGSVMG